MYRGLDATGATEPGIITRDILVSLVIDQGPKGEAGRQFLEDGIELGKVKEIRIEFLNILNIDHVWLLRGLVKLTLSHNVIERIENLDELTNLRELDLSFNRIRVMENLNGLSHVEVLLLYSNEIAVVQGIDSLKKLTILNVGKNKIVDWEHVVYLRGFDALRSLNTSENSCAEMDGYTDYLFAFVPQLLYYRYKMISENERLSAIDKYYRAISNLEENEERERAELALLRERAERDELLTLSYVEYLDGDHLFRQMFSQDEGGKTLSAINEDTQDEFKMYRKCFVAVCRELYELGLQEQDKRTKEIELLRIAVDEGEENTQSKTTRIVDEVLERQINIFANIRDITQAAIETETDAPNHTTARAKELFGEFNDLLSDARTRLMYEEITLHDQIKDINEVFQSNITDMVNSFLETAREYFSRLREADAEYSDAINVTTLGFFSDFVDEKDVPANLLDLWSDKDTLAATLAASRDMHLQVIDDRENRLINRLQDWLREHIDQLVADENGRNRQRILEISHFLGFQQQEFNSLGLPLQLDLTDVELEEVATFEN